MKEAADVRLGVFLDTTRKEPGESKAKVWPAILRTAAALITLATVWIVVGSIVYPFYWFEFFFKRGYRNPALIPYGFDYLLHNAAWVLFAFPIAVLTIWLIAHKWRARTTRLLNRMSVPVIICCLIVCLTDAYLLNRTQRWEYELSFGLRNIAVSVVQLTNVLLNLALPPSRLAPPVDFIYVDAVRISMLHSELAPPFAEEEHTVTTESKSDKSLGLERKPLELKASGSSGTTESRKFKPVAASTSRECLEVINNLLARQAPPYYSTFDQLATYDLLNRIRTVMNSVNESLPPDSLFTGKPLDPNSASIIKQMAEARKKIPAAEIEKGIRSQLSGLSGLIIVRGDFKRLQFGSSKFAEQFKSGPRPIFFRFVLSDKTALQLLPDRAPLFVLGDVIGKWDGGPYLDFHPIAVLSGSAPP